MVFYFYKYKKVLKFLKLIIRFNIGLDMQVLKVKENLIYNFEEFFFN